MANNLLSRRKLIQTAVGVSGVGALAAAYPWLRHKAAMAILEAQKPGVGKEAPDYSVESSDGGKSGPGKYARKVVLMNFWATWCSPCRIEIPWFVEFQKKYEGRGFTVLGTSLEGEDDAETWANVKKFATGMHIPYPVLRGTDEISDLYGSIESLPTTLLIGRDGKIAYWHSGLVGKDVYQKEIEELLAA